MFLEGPGERNHGHLLVEELGLLLLEQCPEALQLGALRLGFLSLLLERRPEALQLGSLRLGLPGPLLRCRLLDVPLTDNPRQFLLQRLLMRSQVRHFRVGFDVLEHQLGIVLPKLAHLGVHPGHLGALFANGRAWVKAC